MSSESRIFEITQVDDWTVLTFRDCNTWDFKFLTSCADELDGLIHEQRVYKLAFDLQNLVQVSSTLLGVFVGLQQSGITIELRNPSAEVREVLETTQLNRVLRLANTPR
jgi:hypothetical protein